MWALYKCGGNNSSYGIDRYDHPMLEEWKRKEAAIGFRIIGHFNTKAEAKAYAAKNGYDVQYGEGA